MVEKTEKRLLAKVSGPNSGYNLYDNLDVPEAFVDGVGQMQVGGAVSKGRFFKNNSVNNVDGVNIENREISFSLIIPTAALLEWIGSISSSMGPHVAAIEAASTNTLNILKLMTKDKQTDAK